MPDAFDGRSPLILTVDDDVTTRGFLRDVAGGRGPRPCIEACERRGGDPALRRAPARAGAARRGHAGARRLRHLRRAPRDARRRQRADRDADRQRRPGGHRAGLRGRARPTSRSSRSSGSCWGSGSTTCSAPSRPWTRSGPASPASPPPSGSGRSATGSGRSATGRHHWSDADSAAARRRPRRRGATHEEFLACVHPDDRAGRPRRVRRGAARTAPGSASSSGSGGRRRS